MGGSWEVGVAGLILVPPSPGWTLHTLWLQTRGFRGLCWGGHPLLETWLSVLLHDPSSSPQWGQEAQCPQPPRALVPWAQGPTGKTPKGVGCSKLPVALAFGERLSSSSRRQPIHT